HAGLRAALREALAEAAYQRCYVHFLRNALDYVPRRVDDNCQTASNRDPGSAWKRDPSQASGQACPGSEQEGPARVAQCPHQRRSGARGRCLFAHRGKPGWHSAAVFEAPALVAGFDDFTMMGQTIEERGRHLGVAKHTGPIAKGQIGGHDNGSALVKPADQMEEQLTAGLSERQVAEFVENNELDASEIFGQPP